MKRSINKILAVLLALAMMLCVSSCGKDDDSISGSGSGQAAGGDVVNEVTGNGFVHSHAVAAGFGMGTDTLADISSRLGAPASSTTDTYTALTVINAEYPFGTFEFESDGSTEPVLTFAEITSDIAGPCGVTIGMDMAQAAEIIYKGSGSEVSPDGEQTVYFYGGDGNVSYGKFVILTIEFTSSETDDFYTLEYCTPAYDQSKVTKFTMFFDEGGKLIRYTLRYS